MGIDLSKFKQIFIDETLEGLDKLESILVRKDVLPLDADSINDLFRIMHSAKGGCGTFGFDDLSNFMHEVESFLDEVRNDKRELTEDHVMLILETKDLLRDSLLADQSGESMNLEEIDRQKQLYIDILAGNDITASSNESSESSTEDSKNQEPLDENNGYQITFIPSDDVFLSGNDPAKYVRGLKKTGEVVEFNIDYSKIPTLAEVSPETCYLSWEIKIITSETEEDIRASFEWIQDYIKTLDIVPANISQTKEEITSKDKKTDDSKDVAPPKEATSDDTKPASDTDTTTEKEVEKKTAEEKEKVDKTKSPAVKKAQPAQASSSVVRSSIRVQVEKIDELLNLVGELVITQSMIKQVVSGLDEDTAEKIQRGIELFEHNSRSLQDSIMRIRMVPISLVFDKIPRLVFELSKQLDKKVDLRVSGEDTELDKTIVEKLDQPMTHLVRNCLDHGLEPTEVRKKNGKPEEGVLNIHAYHAGGRIVIEIKDDGAGICPKKIFKKAVEKGLVAEDASLSKQDILDLLFVPGFSTAQEISNISGRGVGMDVVKNNIKELGGEVSITSELGKGSTFSIQLPLTLAILDGQLIRIGSQTYILPLENIISFVTIEKVNLKSVNKTEELYFFEDDYIPIVRMHKIFNIDDANTNIDDCILIIIKERNKYMALMVDTLLDQQQVVIKNVETNYKKLNGISGATILGDGTISFIIDVNSISKIASKPVDHLTGS
jgi:two-component system chemotaxis sensor kinase CheA